VTPYFLASAALYSFKSKPIVWPALFICTVTTSFFSLNEHWVSYVPAAFLRSCRHFSMRHLRNRTLILRIRQNLRCPLHSVIVDRAEIRINHRGPRRAIFFEFVRFAAETQGWCRTARYCYQASSASPNLTSYYHSCCDVKFYRRYCYRRLVFFVLINTDVPQEKVRRC